MKYAVVIERGLTSYGTHAPDLPGYVTAAKTRTVLCALTRESIKL